MNVMLDEIAALGGNTASVGQRAEGPILYLDFTTSSSSRLCVRKESKCSLKKFIIQ